MAGHFPARPLPKAGSAGILDIDELSAAYYLRLEVEDSPGVLASVADVFGGNGVSIKSMEQLMDEKGLARLIFITHIAKERDFNKTLEGSKSKVGKKYRYQHYAYQIYEMQYISTRAGVPPADFREVLLGGLAADGGLFVPEEFPVLDFNQIAGTARHSEMGRPEMSYPEIAAEVMHPYLEGFIERDEFLDLTAQAYKDFTHPQIAPLVYVEEFDFYLLELFYGPTLAFKDMALQLVGALFEYALQKSDGDHSTILTATSGDTGAAAIYACLGKNNLSAYVLHPEGLVSDIQRRMMTSVSSSNIKNIAIKGNFDDCQNLVKDLFQDSDLANLNLTAMNSINWARISAQAVYYFWLFCSLKEPMKESLFACHLGILAISIPAGWLLKWERP